MKKLMLALAVVSAISITACSSDDDNNSESANDCKTCNLEFLGESVTSEYCDNGDGTMTVTTSGTSETVDLDGATFAQFIQGVELLSTCN